MKTNEIRKECYGCGHRSLKLMEGAEMATDFCDKGQQECSQIVYCHPSIRIPKTKKTQKKRAVE